MTGLDKIRNGGEIVFLFLCWSDLFFCRGDTFLGPLISSVLIGVCFFFFEEPPPIHYDLQKASLTLHWKMQVPTRPCRDYRYQRWYWRSILTIFVVFQVWTISVHRDNNNHHTIKGNGPLVDPEPDWGGEKTRSSLVRGSRSSKRRTSEKLERARFAR